VWARGNRQQPIYLDDHDRRIYLVGLGLVVAEFGWRPLAFCLMGNHIHFLVETPEPNLGQGMQKLHGNYAQFFNRRHAKSGHTFQGRYGSKRMKTDAQLLMAARYIARNPVEAGLCRRAEDWAWGSFAATRAGAMPPTWLDHARLLDLLATWGGDPGERYAALVES
jgi:REP element-mobilizing transposase RayT